VGSLQETGIEGRDLGVLNKNVNFGSLPAPTMVVIEDADVDTRCWLLMTGVAGVRGY
jgi:hypothetical protein